VGESNGTAGHAFLSYVREDTHHVDRLQHILEASDISVWRDTADLWPGEDWRAKIREAITENALVFIACYSRASMARERTYQNEELLLAIDQLRLRRPGTPWLIPVRFNDCDVPDLELGGGRTLKSLQRVDLFGEEYDEEAARLVKGIRRILPRKSDTTADVTPQHKPSSSPLPPTSGASAGTRLPGNTKRVRAGLFAGGLLIWLSGLAPGIRPDHRRRGQYLRSGGAVLITALFTGASVAFAAGATLRTPAAAAVFAAAVSGLGIMALDRWLVRSRPRKGKLRSYVRIAAPRFLLGLILAFAGSMPLALQIFRPEIDHQLTVTRTVVTSTANDPGRNTGSAFAQILLHDGGPSSTSGLIAQRNTLEQQIANLESAPPSCGHSPCDPGTLADAQAQTQEKILEDRGEVSSDNNEIATLRRLAPAGDKSSPRSTTITTGPGNASLVRRLRALQTLAPKYRQRSAACLLLFALFAVIGCLPMLARALLRFGSGSGESAARQPVGIR
jgi:hypothetical protein